MMKGFMKEGNEYLHHYGSGDGFMHFCWCDENKIATGRHTTMADVNKYLTRKTLSGNLVENGWRPIELNGIPCLAAPVRRVPSFTHNAVGIRGKIYFYTISEDRDYNDEIRDFHLTITTEVGGETVEVKHISTRAQIRSFLNNEWVLTEEYPLDDFQFIQSF